MKRLISILLCGTVLLSCKKSNDPFVNLPITLLNFKQDANYKTTTTDDWIFISDENDILLDIEPFESDQAITLTSDKITLSKKMNVTFVVYGKQGGVENCFFYTYVGITPGQTWLRKLPAFPTDVSDNGQFTLNVNNYANSTGIFKASTNAGESYRLSGTISSGNYILKSASPSKFCVTSYRNGSPVILELNNISPGNSTTVDFLTDFKPATHIIPVNVSGVLASRAQIDAGNANFDRTYFTGFIMAYYTNFSGTNSFTLGWNDGYESYRTYVWAGYSTFSKQYNKIGAGPTSVPFSNAALTIVNSDIKNFTFNATGTYNLQKTLWEGTTGNNLFDWYVYGPPGIKQKVGTVPDVLISAYPFLTGVTLNVTGSELTTYLDGYTFDDFVTSIVNRDAATKQGPTEYQTNTFHN